MEGTDGLPRGGNARLPPGLLQHVTDVPVAVHQRPVRGLHGRRRQRLEHAMVHAHQHAARHGQHAAVRALVPVQVTGTQSAKLQSAFASAVSHASKVVGPTQEHQCHVTYMPSNRCPLEVRRCEGRG